MNMIVDFMLLAASGAATIYCFVLSRRLAKLNDLKEGIGASIASMSNALDQTQEVLSFAKTGSLESVTRLTEVLSEAERMKADVAQLIDALGDLADIATHEIEKAKSDAISEIITRRNAVATSDRRAA